MCVHELLQLDHHPEATSHAALLGKGQLAETLTDDACVAGIVISPTILRHNLTEGLSPEAVVAE